MFLDSDGDVDGRLQREEDAMEEARAEERARRDEADRLRREDEERRWREEKEARDLEFGGGSNQSSGLWPQAVSNDGKSALKQPMLKREMLKGDCDVVELRNMDEKY